MFPRVFPFKSTLPMSPGLKFPFWYAHPAEQLTGSPKPSQTTFFMARLIVLQGRTYSVSQAVATLADGDKVYSLRITV